MTTSKQSMLNTLLVIIEVVERSLRVPRTKESYRKTLANLGKISSKGIDSYQYRKLLEDL